MRTVSPARYFSWLLPLAMMLVMVACLPGQGAPESATPTSTSPAVPQRAKAPVEAIDILQNNSFPVQVSVSAQGHFANECTVIDQIRQERRGGTFSITIDSVQYAADPCLQNRIAFEESISLDVIGLPAGIYVVDVNGLQGTFKLQRDNILDEGNAVVGGLVWLDRCDLLSPGDGQPIEATAGCVDLGEGRYAGDGLQAASEVGVSGVKVSLGAGLCPSVGLATTLTVSDGTFLFSGLTAGDYCLTVIAGQEADGPLAGEGMWTFPPDSSGQRTVSVQPGESNLDSSFGWTAVQSEAEPVFFATPTSRCTNKALFIADVTVPDDTPFSAGETFTKTWRLQNLGSCLWDPSYSLVFTGGERMDAPESAPLTLTVPPGEFVDLSIRLVAPQTPGQYRGEWKLAKPDGGLFGIGPGSDRAFWVQVTVIEEVADD